MSIRSVEVEIGLITNDVRSSLAIKLPSHDLSSHEIFFFLHGDARIVPLDLRGSTEEGLFRPLETCVADVEKLRRIFPYLFVLKDCGQWTKPILRIVANGGM